MKTKLLLALLLSSLSLHSYAQGKKQPHVTIGNVSGGTVTRAQLLATPRLTDANGLVNVSDFIITFLPNGSDEVGPFATKGNALTTAEIAIIRSLKTPARIFIENIHVVEINDGLTRTSGNIVLNVK